MSKLNVLAIVIFATVQTVLSVPNIVYNDFKIDDINSTIECFRISISNTT